MKNRRLLYIALVALCVACQGKPTAEHTVCFFGSSVCRGVGADKLAVEDTVAGFVFSGYAWQVAQQLPKGWTAVNISVDGNNTYDLMARFDKDLATVDARYVVIGLSLGNEGLHEDGEAAVLSYKDNMQTLIRRIRALGRIPIVCNNYPRADFCEADYRDLIETNLEMQEWDVMTINLCGTIDDGAGHWAEGYWNGTDKYHPNQAGHTEFMTAFPPSLLEALARDEEAGRHHGNRTDGKGRLRGEAEGAKKVSFKPDGIVHSYTLSYWDADTCLTTVYSHARHILMRYKNAVLLTTEECHSVPDVFAIQGNALHDLRFYRSAMNSVEVEALVEGRDLRSSLDIEAPLVGAKKDENMAQSLQKLQVE